MRLDEPSPGGEQGFTNDLRAGSSFTRSSSVKLIKLLRSEPDCNNLGRMCPAPGPATTPFLQGSNVKAGFGLSCPFSNLFFRDRNAFDCLWFSHGIIVLRIAGEPCQFALFGNPDLPMSLRDFPLRYEQIRTDDHTNVINLKPLACVLYT